MALTVLAAIAAPVAPVAPVDLFAVALAVTQLEEQFEEQVGSWPAADTPQREQPAVAFGVADYHADGGVVEAVAVVAAAVAVVVAAAVVAAVAGVAPPEQQHARVGHVVCAASVVDVVDAECAGRAGHAERVIRAGHVEQPVPGYVSGYCLVYSGCWRRSEQAKGWYSKISDGDTVPEEAAVEYTAEVGTETDAAVVLTRI